ncbi:hypothetical protein KVR01_001050 [Diaporthe batatas]|uniref:uncharacterized protein n=1 Tax=Diaporthe batatas TaxID=748121 RepID=UPI001D045652|nr:uncharacterized protein KVR01_001050 [Diaporthe batatas]KAG8170305.1 hypothetical protein KVR01_001050 [Diaporthe batatas]
MIMSLFSGSSRHSLHRSSEIFVQHTQREEMQPSNPDAVAEGIARFVQTAQMEAYTEQISSLEETVKALQADNQEINCLKASFKSLQASTEKSDSDIAALKDFYHQEIASLQNTVKSLRDSNEKAAADIAKLQGQHHQEVDSFKAILNSLQASSVADITQLREEIAELCVQRRRAEEPTVHGEPPRDHGTRQSAMQLQEPSGRQSLHSRFARKRIEHQVIPRRETKTNIQPHPFHDDSDNHTAGPKRPQEQQYPRGIKRAHVDDAAEFGYGDAAAEEAGNAHRLEQPQSQKTRHTKRSDHKHGFDELPTREGKMASEMEDHNRARFDEFAAYYQSKRKIYKKTTVGRDKGALVRHFIDGIEDPGYCRWFQNALKEQFPERVHNLAHPTGRRFVSVPRDLTWEDAKTVVRDIPTPYSRN